MRCRTALHAQGWLASGAQNIAAWLSGSRTQEPIILHRDAVSGGGYATIGTVISLDLNAA